MRNALNTQIKAQQGSLVKADCDKKARHVALIEAVHRFMENTAEFLRSEEQEREGRRKGTACEWVKRAEVGGPFGG